MEILFIRFIMGFLALFLVCPRRLRGTDLKQEFTLAGAGLCGICLYYLLENIALTYTLAQNVGVIISVAPFFTAILSRVFDEYDLSGIGASALCFVTWNFAVKMLGAVKTSVYIYMVPVITVITSALILGERITWLSGGGTLLTLVGLFISEKKFREKRNPS